MHLDEQAIFGNRLPGIAFLSEIASGVGAAFERLPASVTEGGASSVQITGTDEQIEITQRSIRGVVVNTAHQVEAFEGKPRNAARSQDLGDLASRVFEEELQGDSLTQLVLPAVYVQVLQAGSRSAKRQGRPEAVRDNDTRVELGSVS